VPEHDTQPIRLLVVDDHKIVRVGLLTLFGWTNRIQVVGEAGSVAGAIEEAARLEPDVVLMDVRLSDGSGVEACREIRAARPETRVLFLTSFEDDEAVLATMFADADGYLLKEIEEENLIRAIETVAAGQSILDPSIKLRMLAFFESGEINRHNGLSSQEQRVLALVAQGKTNKAIAVILELSEKTVRNHLSNIYQKLHVTSRSHAAAIYARRFPSKEPQS